MLNKQWLGFDFLKTDFEIFFVGHGQAQPGFQAQLKFSAGIQLFGMKNTSYRKPDQKIHFRGQI